MAIKRCPYCRSIIDERDQFCNNCGTQLLFPEDEFIEEEIPGEKLVDADEKAEAGDVDLDLSLEEPEAATIARSATAMGFPESLTVAESGKKKGRKSKKAEPEEAETEPSPERILKTSELPEMGTDLVEEQAAGKTSAELRFDDVFTAKPADAKAALPRTQGLGSTKSRSDETSLSASAEEIEDIARMMSSLDKGPKDKPKEPAPLEVEPAVPPAERNDRAPAVGDTAFYQRKIDDIRRETLYGGPKDKSATGELKKSGADVPPWATGLHVESPLPGKLERSDIPGMVDTSKEDLRHETVSDILSKLENEPLLPAGGDRYSPGTRDEIGTSEPTGETEGEAEVETRGEVEVEGEEPTRERPSRWDELPDRASDTQTSDSWSDRLGRDRQEARVERPAVRRTRAVGGSRVKGKVYDLLLILIGWVLAVWLATKILSVSMTDIFSAAAVPLFLFLLTLAVAYFFLFLYFLGETLGDRLSSS